MNLILQHFCVIVNRNIYVKKSVVLYMYCETMYSEVILHILETSYC